MRDLKVIIDESGAKGYANNLEKYEGEFGIATAIIFKGENEERIQKEALKIHSRYSDLVDGKFHITSLQSEKQKDLRKEVFNLIVTEEIWWTYQAIYTNGFYDERYKKLGFRCLKKFHYSLHVQLLFNIFIQILTFADISNINIIEITSDPLDKSIVEDLSRMKKDFFSIGDPTKQKYKHYNRETGILETEEQTISTSQSEEEKETLSRFKHSFLTTDNELTLIADVLANSISFYLKKKVEKAIGIELNTSIHFEKHELFEKLFMKEEKSFLDQIYKYKKLDRD